MARHKFRCRFCSVRLTKKGSNPTSQTDEHVLPEWLLDHYDMKGHWLAHARVRPSTGELLSEPREQYLGSLRLGKVCYGCNHGWMSELEKAAKPTLIAMIDGELKPQSLNSHQREAVARWVLKTTFAFQEATDLRKAIPLTHALKARDWTGKLPNGMGIFASNLLDNPTSRSMFYNQSVWPTVEEDAARIDRDEVKRSYKSGIAVGRIGLMVAYWPSYSQLHPYFLDMHLSPLARDLEMVPLVNGKHHQPCKDIEHMALGIRLSSDGYMDAEDIERIRYINIR